MPIEEGWQLVKDAFQKTVAGGGFDYSRFPLQDLQPPAIRRVQANGTLFEEATCGVKYGELRPGQWSHEVQIWHIALMFVKYVAGVLKDKAKEGHCYNHAKPCARSRAFHLDMLHRFKADLEELVREIGNLPSEAGSWPAAINPPPVPSPSTAGT
jgi:hypothetical protein